ncbi:MAG: hypothetical protein M1840_005744 [Geoglossum simile]|nr:MAG: hypothetical protein M1840_005744 [Geoglossum simile]
MDNQRPSSWPCPYCSQCFLTGAEIRDHLELRLRNALPEILKVLLNTACHPVHDDLDMSEEEPNADNPDSKTDLKCPHPKCEGKKPFTRKKNLQRHYQDHIECNAKCGFCGSNYSRIRGFIIYVRGCKDKKSQEGGGLSLNKEQRQTIKLKEQLSKRAIKELDRRIRARQKHGSEEQDSSSGSDDEGPEEERELDQSSSVRPQRLNKHLHASFSVGDSNGLKQDEAETILRPQRLRKRQRPNESTSSETDMHEESSGQSRSERVSDSETDLSVHDHPQRPIEGVNDCASSTNEHRKELEFSQVNIQDTGQRGDAEMNYLDSSQLIEPSTQSSDPPPFLTSHTSQEYNDLGSITHSAIGPRSAYENEPNQQLYPPLFVYPEAWPNLAFRKELVNANQQSFGVRPDLFFRPEAWPHLAFGNGLNVNQQPLEVHSILFHPDMWATSNLGP